MLYLYQEQLEKQQLNLKTKNDKLNSYIRSNLQLENFAHLASHELRTPLNNVTNFTSLLKKKTNHKLEEGEKKIMDVVTDEVAKMNKLIEDLLQLSMVKNTKMTFSVFDINQLINEILDKYFKSSRPFIKTDIQIKKVKGQKDLLSQLFINLIENAIKFSKSSEAQLVKISGYETKENYQFSLSDNGIGIQDEYKEHVFLIFKRLHNSSQYAGTGIGLSICKSIVERHGGNISVKDNLAGGSIFEFSISKNH